jgi:hypothetical protein
VANQDARLLLAQTRSRTPRWSGLYMHRLTHFL